jgi:hypothetical protein
MVPSLKMKQPALCRGLNQQKKQNMGNRDQTMVTKCSYPWLINHWSHLIKNIVTINWLINHWRFPKMVVPPLKFIMENPNNKWMIWEVPLFEETPIWGKKRIKIKRIDLSSLLVRLRRISHWLMCVPCVMSKIVHNDNSQWCMIIWYAACYCFTVWPANTIHVDICFVLVPAWCPQEHCR